MGSFEWRAVPSRPADPAMKQCLLERAFGMTEGWLLIDEALALHAAVRDHLAGGRPVTVVEIGSWKGRSAIVMALAIGTPATGSLIAIDPHEGSSEAQVRGMPGSTLADMRANLSRAGVSEIVRVLRCHSAQALALVPDGTVDVLFVDGSHRYEDVSHDLRRWTGKLRDGATVAINDWSMPGVWRALNRWVLPLRRPFADALVVDNTLFVRYSGRLRLLPGGRGHRAGRR